jgi:hypothetical protein
MPSTGIYAAAIALVAGFVATLYCRLDLWVGLQIDSTEGRGTSVHLFFPRAEALGVRSATSA